MKNIQYMFDSLDEIKSFQMIYNQCIKLLNFNILQQFKIKPLKNQKENTFRLLGKVKLNKVESRWIITFRWIIPIKTSKGIVDFDYQVQEYRVLKENVILQVGYSKKIQEELLQIENVIFNKHLEIETMCSVTHMFDGLQRLSILKS